MKRISAFALSFISAAVLVTSTSAEAPKPMRGLVTTRARPVAPINAQAKAPRAYTKQQKALAIANTLKLAIPPVLGEPISVTPSRLAVPGLVTTWMQDVHLFRAGSEGGGDAIIFRNTPDATLYILFSALPGKHYAFDCTTTARKVVYTSGTGTSNSSSGEATTDSSLHAIFATPQIQQAGWYHVDMKFPTPGVEEEEVYGCEISPF